MRCPGLLDYQSLQSTEIGLGSRQRVDLPQAAGPLWAAGRLELADALIDAGLAAAYRWMTSIAELADEAAAPPRYQRRFKWRERGKAW